MLASLVNVVIKRDLFQFFSNTVNTALCITLVVCAKLDQRQMLFSDARVWLCFCIIDRFLTLFFTMFQVCLPPHQIQIHKLCFWAFGWVGRSGEWLYLRWSVMCMINVVFGANFLWVSEFWNLVKIEQNPVIWLLQRKKIVCQSSRENHVAAENHPKLTR